MSTPTVRLLVVDDHPVVRQGLRIGHFCGGARAGSLTQIERNDFVRAASMVQREVVHSAIKPAPRLAHLVELCMKFHERFLNDILGRAKIRDQTQGITQERRFQSGKKLLDRFRSGRFDVGFVRLGHGHAWLSHFIVAPV